LVANASKHDEPLVLEACDVLERYGSPTDQTRGRALRAAILSRTMRTPDQTPVWPHRLAILADLFGAVALFGLLFLLLLFTPD
jgi:hypothetical protein